MAKALSARITQYLLTNRTAEDVGVEIRLTIERLGGTMPEDLPLYKRLSRYEWVPELKDDDDDLAELPPTSPASE